MKEKRVKKYLIFGGILLLILVIGATYAYFMAIDGGTSNVPINVTSSTTDSLTFRINKDINIKATMSNFSSDENTGMSQEDFATATAILIANNKTNAATDNYYVYLEIMRNELVYSIDENTPELILQVKKPGSTEYLTATEAQALGGTLKNLEYVTDVEDKNGLKFSGFDITGYEGLITIADNKEIVVTTENSEHKTEETWEVRIVLVNYDDDQTDNGGKSLSAKIIMQKDERILSPILKSVEIFGDYYDDVLDESGSEYHLGLVSSPKANIEVYYSEEKNGTYSLLKEIAKDDEELNRNGISIMVPDGKKYFVKVRYHFNESGEDSYSNYSNIVEVGGSLIFPQIACTNGGDAMDEFNNPYSIVFVIPTELKGDGFEIYVSENEFTGYTKLDDVVYKNMVDRNQLLNPGYEAKIFDSKNYYYKIRFFDVYDGERVLYSEFSNACHI